MIPPSLPLNFPADADLWVEPYLAPYDLVPDPNRSFSLPDFVDRVIHTDDWYGLMSAFGTGKTSLIHNLIHQLSMSESHPVVPLAKIDLGIWHSDQNPDHVLRGIAMEIATRMSDCQCPIPDPSSSEEIRASFVDWLVRAITPLKRGGRPAKVLICLDDFQRLVPDAMRILPEQLKSLHDAAKGRVVCLVATDIDLKRSGRDVSPLHGIIELLTLLDFHHPEQWEQVERIARERGSLKIGEMAWEHIQQVTGGYPFWVREILHRLAKNRSKARITLADVDRTITNMVGDRSEPRLVEIALQSLQTWARQRMPEHAAIFVLQQLLQSAGPLKTDESAAEPLALQGIVRFDHQKNVTWRNPLIEQFMRKHQEMIESLGKRDTRPGHLLRARGRIRVTLVMNLSRFVCREDKRRFEALRGTDEYATALDKLEDTYRGPENQHKFEVKDSEDQLRNIGTDLYIFTNQAAQRAFTPVYHLRDALSNYQSSSTFDQRLEEGVQPGDYEPVIRDEWSKWHAMSVQFTQEGSAVVRLIREFGQQDSQSELHSVLEDVLGLERQFEEKQVEEEIRELAEKKDYERAAQVAERAHTSVQAHEIRRRIERSVQWEIAMRLVEALIRDAFAFSGLEAQGYCTWAIAPRVTLRLAPGGERDVRENEPIYPLHDRYVIFEFDKMCDCPDHHESNILDAKDFHRDAHRARELAGLLEGVSIEDRKGKRVFPDMKEAEGKDHLANDLSSWQRELCLITLDNALIYYKRTELGETGQEGAVTEPWFCHDCGRRETESVRQIYFPGRRVRYVDYWQAVIRGLEHIIGLRLAAHLVSNRTANYLAEMADLTHLITPRADLPAEDASRRVQELRDKVTNATRVLSFIRDAAIPLSIARSDFAARKFDTLVQKCGIREAVESAEGNIRHLNDFLAHYDDTMIERSNVAVQASHVKILRSIEELTDKSQQGNIAAITISIILASGLVISIWAQILQGVIEWWALIIASGVLIAFFVAIAVREVNRQMQDVDRKYHPEKYEKKGTP